MSTFDDILSGLSAVLPVLERVAPTLATAVGGPLAGTAVTFLEKTLGLDAGAGASAVSAALATATPDQLAALKKADNDFAVQMEQARISVLKMDYDDRASARQREATVKDRMPGVLAVVLTIGFFGLLTALLIHAAPVENQTVLNIILGALAAGWGQMVSYYYGSSRGSQAKDLLVYNSAPIQPGTASR
jgi:hypothetical protein